MVVIEDTKSAKIKYLIIVFGEDYAEFEIALTDNELCGILKIAKIVNNIITKENKLYCPTIEIYRRYKVVHCCDGSEFYDIEEEDDLALSDTNENYKEGEDK